MKTLLLFSIITIYSCNKGNYFLNGSLNTTTDPFYSERIIYETTRFLQEVNPTDFIVQQQNQDLVIFNVCECSVPTNISNFKVNNLDTLVTKLFNKVLKKQVCNNRNLLAGKLVVKVAFYLNGSLQKTIEFEYKISELLLVLSGCPI